MHACIAAEDGIAENRNASGICCVLADPARCIVNTIKAVCNSKTDPWSEAQPCLAAFLLVILAGVRFAVIHNRMQCTLLSASNTASDVRIGISCGLVRMQ